MTLAQLITAVYQQGYRDGAHDLDDLKAELHDVEQQMWALGQQRRRVA